MTDEAPGGEAPVGDDALHHGDVIATNRLESFSDGVMAVIITIMAFELKPPVSEHWAAISHRLPALLVYMLSFTFIGIYWNNHHHLLRVTKNISASVMWANLVLLFWLSLVPLATQWVGGAYRSAGPAAAYGLVALGAAITYYALVRTILRANHHDERLLAAVSHDVKGIVSAGIYLMGIALSFLSPYLAYACYTVVSIMWFVPDRRLTRRPT